MKNDYEVRGEVTAIFLKSKKHGMRETLIDTEDLEKVKEFPNAWCYKYDAESDTCYAMGGALIDGKQKYFRLHRWLMDSTDLHVDHINHDTLDNRRSVNLREVTNAENRQNLMGALSNSKSGILGVSWHKRAKKWKVSIAVGRKYIYVGLFEDIAEAEKAAIEARIKYMPFSLEALADSRQSSDIELPALRQKKAQK